MHPLDDLETTKKLPTRGKKKLTRHLLDMLKNNDLQQELDKYYDLLGEDEHFGTDKSTEHIQALAMRYKISTDLITRLIGDRELRLNSGEAPEIEVCVLQVPSTKLLSKSMREAMTPQERVDSETYPVNILISAHATKRDIIEFLSNNWPDIEFFLRRVNPNPIRARKRINDDIEKIIRGTLDLPAKEVAKKVRQKLARTRFYAEDVYRWRSRLKKRFQKSLAK